MSDMKKMNDSNHYKEDGFAKNDFWTTYEIEKTGSSNGAAAKLMLEVFDSVRAWSEREGNGKCGIRTRTI